MEPNERQERVEIILRALNDSGFPNPIEPRLDIFSIPPNIHTADYLDFLKSIHSDWQKQGFGGNPMAMFIPARRQKQVVTQRLIGKVGYYSLGVDSQITAGTYSSAMASASSALAAQNSISLGEKYTFALCRPPGHHSTRDQFGGFCYLNNAAIAAQGFLDHGKTKVAILDVDYHHGNGTQDIFYNRNDVLFASIHADPDQAFPYFTGYIDERGDQAGEGYNYNIPLPPGTKWKEYKIALGRAIRHIDDFKAEVLIVSLGTDIHQGDPLGTFEITNEDFTSMGKIIKELGLPTLVVMEGGYIHDDFGNAVTKFLTPFK